MSKAEISLTAASDHEICDQEIEKLSRALESITRISKEALDIESTDRRAVALQQIYRLANLWVPNNE